MHYLHNFDIMQRPITITIPECTPSYLELLNKYSNILLLRLQ